MRATWSTLSRMPVCLATLKPASSALDRVHARRAGAGTSSRRSGSSWPSRVRPVRSLCTVTVAPGTTAPLASFTVPVIWPVAVCALAVPAMREQGKHGTQQRLFPHVILPCPPADAPSGVTLRPAMAPRVPRDPAQRGKYRRRSTRAMWLIPRGRTLDSASGGGQAPSAPQHMFCLVKRRTRGRRRLLQIENMAFVQWCFHGTRLHLPIRSGQPVLFGRTWDAWSLRHSSTPRPRRKARRSDRGGRRSPS